MKRALIFIFFIGLMYSIEAENSHEYVTSELNDALKEKEKYTDLKQTKIARLKIARTDLTLFQQYKLNISLCQEYRKFKLDSAICYAKKSLQNAKDLNRTDLKNEAFLQLVPLYTSTGLFREAESILSHLNKSTLNKNLLPDYYEAYRQFFEHYATNHDLKEYNQQAELYRDSLLATLPPSSIRYRINAAEKDIKRGQIDRAEKDLLILLSMERKNSLDYPMTAYLLGKVYKKKNNIDLEKRYITISAIADIKNAIKDNASLQHLASIYYHEGDVDYAYKCTSSAIEDAIFCNVQFRTLYMSELYNIINTSYLEKESLRKDQLKLYLLLISILTVFLTIAIVYVYKQMRRLSKIKEALFQTTQRLEELNKDISKTNEQLQDRNVQLSESNRIKEEYIANFFDLCSAYIDKLEKYRTTLNKKALARQYDELFSILKSKTLVDTELDELYKTFDHIFINLYPTFVKDFNSLLIPEEQVVLKQGELLNTELRIFALIRLGITDSVKIAAFLRYSLSSIYNYRTRARNKAAVTRNEFEEMVMKIGTMVRKTI